MPLYRSLLRTPVSRAPPSLLHFGHADSTHGARRHLLPPSASTGRGAHALPNRRLFLGALIAAGAAPLAAQSAVQTGSFSAPTAGFSDLQALQGSGVAAPARPLDPPTYVKATGRIVSIGDLHGDLGKTVRSFQAAGVMELNEQRWPVWTGGDTTVVQLGDVMDRGGDEIRIVSLLRDLDTQARAQGGAVYMLNGNHESLNLCGNFRYVTMPGFIESAEFAGAAGARDDLESMDQAQQVEHLKYLGGVRHALFRPGGPMAMELSKNPTVLIVNDTAFAHGGLLPAHVAYGIERLNSEVAAWMRADDAPNGGHALPPFLAMGDGKSVMWTRALSKEVFTPHERYNACRALYQALDKVGAKRLIVGHTPQVGGCNCECDGQVWRIDVGMSYGVLNKPVQILEIREDILGKTVVQILGEDGLPWQAGSEEDISFRKEDVAMYS